MGTQSPMTKPFAIGTLILPILMIFGLMYFTRDAAITCGVTAGLCFYLTTFIYEKFIGGYEFEMLMIEEFVDYEENKKDSKPPI